MLETSRSLDSDSRIMTISLDVVPWQVVESRITTPTESHCEGRNGELRPRAVRKLLWL
jgi:hypothetical protein